MQAHNIVFLLLAALSLVLKYYAENEHAKTRYEIMFFGNLILAALT